MKKRRLGTAAALGLLLAEPVQASIALNFGALSNTSFGTSGNLTQPYATVAPGINATMTVAAPFISLNPSNNGSVMGDLRVNAANSESVNITIALWDATIGSGYTTQARCPNYDTAGTDCATAKMPRGVDEERMVR